MNFHVQPSLGILVPVHHLDDFLTRDQLCLGRTEVVLARRDLFPTLTGELRMLHRVPGSIAEKLASGIEPLFFPNCVDIFEECFAEAKIDLYRFRPVVAACGIRARHIHMLCLCIY